MKGNLTLTLIKPDAIKKGLQGKILDTLIHGGFEVVALKMLQLTSTQAEQFYQVHQNRPFYNDLVDFMSSGPIIAAILKKENAVEALREYIGNTDPLSAKPGTVRNLFGTTIQQNAIHGSDSDENAMHESGFFFNQIERIC